MRKSIRIIGGTSTVLGSLAAWSRAEFVPVGVRIATVVAAVLVVLLAAAVEFRDATKSMSDRRRRKWAIPVAGVLAAAGVTLIYFTVAWHTVLRDRCCRASELGWQCVAIGVPAFPTTIRVDLSIDPQSGPKADWFPGFWADPNGAIPTIKTNDDYQFTVELVTVGEPTRYGVSYRRTGPASNVSFLTPGTPSWDRSTLVRRSLIGGGFLWLVGAVALYYSLYWLPWVLAEPKDRRDIIIPDS